MAQRTDRRREAAEGEAEAVTDEAQIAIAIIAAVAPTTVAALAVYLGVKNRSQGREQLVKTTAVKEKVDSVDTKVDGRFTELLNLVLKMSHDQGVNDGEQKERDRK